MILDNIENAPNYFGLHPLFEKAFDYINSLDMNNLTTGTVEIESAYLKVSVVESVLKSKAEAKLETHKKFIDIHIPVGAEEIFGWKSLNSLQQPIDKYDSQNDFQLFNDKPSAYINVLPGEFIVFSPEDAHAPLIGDGNTKKIIVKIAVL